jgi:feruloyl-CoA synthase
VTPNPETRVADDQDWSAKAPTRQVSLAPRDGEIEARADGTILLRRRESLEPHPTSWNQRLAHWAALTPDRIFLTEAARDGRRRSITYAEMLHRVMRVGEALLALGASPERPVAILGENTIDVAAVTLAALWVGVPASPVSPAYALAAPDYVKLIEVLAALGPAVAYVGNTDRYGDAVRTAFAADIPLIVSGKPIEGRSCREIRTLARATLNGSGLVANRKVGPDTIGKILFTSGSSGTPKPAIIPHGMLAANRQQNTQVFPFMMEEPPEMVDWLPWHHTFGGNNNFGFALWCGGTLHIDDGRPTPQGIERTVDLLRRFPPTIYFNTPNGFDMLLPHLKADRAFAERFFSRLKLIQYGGALLPEHIWRGIDEAAVATVGMRILIVSGIGSTECGSTATNSSWEQHRKPEAGLPVAGVEAKLVPVEDTWELRLRGACVSPGYWHRPDLTAAAFDEEGYFKLGDAVKPVDGDFANGILFDGRISDNFKLSTGTWVSSGNLRTRLIAALAPVLKDAVITGHNRNEVGAIGFPDLDAVRTITAQSSRASDAEVLSHPALRSWLESRLDALATGAKGSSERIARFVLEAEPPSLDNGELTDKSVAAARVVLTRRAEVVEELHASPPTERVILTR